MNWTQLLGLLSPAAGFLGAVVQKGVGIYEERQRHRHELERLELAARIDVQKADLSLRQTREDHAGQAFTAAIEAQGALKTRHAWVTDVVALFRPGLTTLVLLASIGHATFVVRQGGDADAYWQGIHALAAMSFGYWFGMRSFEKGGGTDVRMAVAGKK